MLYFHSLNKFENNKKIFFSRTDLNTAKAEKCTLPLKNTALIILK